MLKLGAVKYRSKCSRHRNYNPAADGEGAIKGGCTDCTALLEIYQAHRKLVQLISRRPSSTPRKPRTKPNPQQKLFTEATA